MKEERRLFKKTFELFKYAKTNSQKNMKYTKKTNPQQVKFVQNTRPGSANSMVKQYLIIVSETSSHALWYLKEHHLSQI